MATVQQPSVKEKNTTLQLKKKEKEEQVVDDMHWISNQLEAPSPASTILDTSSTMTTDAPTTVAMDAQVSSGSSASTATAGTSAGTVGMSTGMMIGLGVAGATVIAVAGNGGSSSSSSSTEPTTEPTEAPTVEPQTLNIQDGPIEGADVTAELNGEIIVLGTTDENGQLMITDPAVLAQLSNMSIIATGGTDITTGLEFTGELKAPAGSTMVNPLTTLVQNIVEQNPNVSVADAQSQVKTALGLSDSVDLTTFNPSTSEDSTLALAVQKAAVQVVTVMNQLADAFGGDAVDMSSAVASAMAEMIASSTGAIDLTSTATLTAIATSSATSAGVTGFDATSVVSALSTDIASVKASTSLADLTNIQKEVTPTEAPTSAPTDAPTDAPTEPPTIAPTTAPSGGSGGGSTPPADTTPPTLQITSDVSSVKAGETATVTFTFSEEPTGFAESDVIVTGGTLSNFAVSSSNTKVYTATFTPTADTASGNASITVASGAYTDAAGNTGGAGTTPSISIDTTAPTLVTTVPADYNVSYGPTSFSAVTSADGTKIILTASEAIALGTATESSFTLSGTSLTVTDVAVDGSDSTKLNLTLSGSLVRNADAVSLTYSGGLTDVAGNVLDTFSTGAVHNAVTQTLNQTITSYTLVQQDATGDKNYIQIGGSGFSQLLDSANGALASTNIASQFDWSKFTWNIDGDANNAVNFVEDDIAQVSILTDTSMKIYITDNKWTSLTNVDNLLSSGSTSTADRLVISSGFLADADGTTSTATRSAVFDDTQFTYTISASSTPPDIYASSVMLDGAGDFDGDKLKASAVAPQVSGTGELHLNHMYRLGVLESKMTGGSLVVDGWGGSSAMTVSEAGIINDNAVATQVWIDSANLGNTTLSGFTLMGDNFTIAYDEAASDLMLDHGSGGNVGDNLQYIGSATTDGALTVSGFTSGLDTITLDKSILTALTDTTGASPVTLEQTEFVSRTNDHIAQDANDFIIYDQSNGGVYYDADANGSSSVAVLLLTLTDKPTSLDYTDFKVI